MTHYYVYQVPVWRPHGTHREEVFGATTVHAHIDSLQIHFALHIHDRLEIFYEGGVIGWCYFAFGAFCVHVHMLSVIGRCNRR